MFQILDEMSELIYVSDVQNYDLLYINQAGKELFGLGKICEGKCYRLLQGRDSPCEFCTNGHLAEASFYTWDKTNPLVGRHFLLKDKIIDWKGRKARVEIAFDMSEQEARRKAISDALELQNLVTECAKRLYEADENEGAVDDVLRMAGEYLHSDRVYIFEIHGEKMENTHEWCSEGVSSQIENLQDMPVSLIERWREPFETQSYALIENLEAIRETSPEEYAILKEQEIHSVIAVPLFLRHELIGYVGVDNYSIQMRENTTAFLNSIGYFITSMLRQQRIMAQLEWMSCYDSLTGLKNRNAYVEDIKKAYKSPVGVVYLDVNGMKQINNQLGHKDGDDVLRLTAGAISTVFEGAECYRIGGDEFLAVCEGMESAEFQEKTQRLKNYVEFQTEYHISVGTSWLKSCDDLREMVFQADQAMSEDKKAFYRGKALSGRYRSQTDDILGLADEETLRTMLRQGRFHVYYQPQVDVRTRRVTGAEALVRCEDGSGGFYSPAQFIPVLEETRLISILDFFVFERVCSQLREWREKGIAVVPVSTNFSRHTLAVEGFAERLQGLCGKYGMEQSLLEVEITETVEADNRLLFYHAVEQLNRRNFRISIDDFGVNNANLSLITDMDFHVLKIDKHVIDGVADNRKSGLLVSALINICHQMGIKIIAEGVESEEQLRILRDMDCDVVQGYLFGRPVPTEDFRSRFLCGDILEPHGERARE